MLRIHHTPLYICPSS